MKCSRAHRICAAMLSVSLMLSPIAASPASAEAATALMFLKWVGAKLAGAAALGTKAGGAAAVGTVAMPAAMKFVAVTSGLRTVALTQSSHLFVARTAVTVTKSTISVVPKVNTGIAVKVALNRAAVTKSLTAAGIGYTTGSYAADDELAAEIAVAKGRGENTFQLFVCERADGTSYAVPSSWVQCPGSNETLKATERPLELQNLG
jgi:hypothetical protein